METRYRSRVGVGVAAILAVLFAAPAWAIDAWRLDVGVVIPFAMYDDSGRDTVVGILAPNTTAGDIYWAFIDANGNRLAGDFIPTRNNVVAYSFSLSAALRGTGGAPDVGKGAPGYLVMIYDNNGVLQAGEKSRAMAANAFLVNLSDFDAVFLPVIPLERGDLAGSDIDLLNFPPSALLSLTNADYYSTNEYVRFLTGPGDDPRTLLIVFTPTDAPSSFDAEAFGIDGTSQAGLKVPAVTRRLNVVNVASIPGLAFSEGYLNLVSSTASRFGLVFAFTRASVVGAEQTVLRLTR